jgi:Rrf2 family nitric oxide-sensitive transcriptional repressor
MHIHNTTYHALCILVDQAQAGDAPLTYKDIARDVQLTKENVFKIGALLCNAGFLASERGWQGGQHLARPAAEIRVGDVVRALEPTQRANTAPKLRGHKLEQVWDAARAAYFAALNRYTIADLARAPERMIGLRPPTVRLPRSGTQPRRHRSARPDRLARAG